MKISNIYILNVCSFSSSWRPDNWCQQTSPPSFLMISVLSGISLLGMAKQRALSEASRGPSSECLDERLPEAPCKLF